MKYIEKTEIDVEHSILLYQSVDWSSYCDSIDIVNRLLSKSLWWCSCVVNQEVVGLVRVVGDGVSIVYIQDLSVNPTYQRKGIASGLMNQVFQTFDEVR